MENKISNDIFRNFMLKNIFTNNEFDEIEIDENMHIYIYSKKLENFYLADNSLLEAIYNGAISVAYLDAYKVLNAKLKDSTISFEESIIFNKIQQIYGIEDLQEKLDNDPYLLEELLKYSLEFIRMNDLCKIGTIKKLSECQKYNLQTNFQIFENDITQFKCTKDNQLELLAKYYDSEMRKIEDSIDANELGQVSLNLMNEIIGFIKMLCGYDYENYKILMEDIIILDYKWNKYIVDSNYKYDIFDIESMLYRIYLLEENSLNSLIDECSYNSNYFEELIDSMILIKCDNMYIDEKIINQEIVDEYFENIFNKKLK